MVCRKGFEPLTPWLKVKCSTTELAAHMVPLERFKLPTFWFVARRAVQLRQRGIWWPKAGSNCRTEIFSLLLFLLSYRAILALSQLSRICVSPELIAGIEPSLVAVPWWMSWSWTNNLAESEGLEPSMHCCTTVFKTARLPIITTLQLAETERVELSRAYTPNSLANCPLHHLGKSPCFGGRGGIWTHTHCCTSF